MPDGALCQAHFRRTLRQRCRGALGAPNQPARPPPLPPWPGSWRPPRRSFRQSTDAPVSKDTLLRSIRRGGRPDHAAPTVVGIDDWAWRRNQRYGTIICDLDRRRPIRLLPDREPATARGWLAGQQQIQVVARDRGGGYALAAAQALPHACQVADRWHLMENASRAFLDAVRYSMREIRRAVGTTTVNPDLLTAVERLQYEGYLRRQEDNETILKQAQSGLAIKEIVAGPGAAEVMCGRYCAASGPISSALGKVHFVNRRRN